MRRRLYPAGGSRRCVRATLLDAGLVIAVLLVPQLSAQEKRPGKQPDFSDGFRAFKQKGWSDAVDHMVAALERWPEDGELTRVYGRWFEPYIPHYYLGVAFLELGCYRRALDELDETLLNWIEVKGAKRQKEQLESLKHECEKYLRQGITEQEGVGCDRWASPTERE